MGNFSYLFLIIISLALVGTITFDSAFAQSYTGVLTLDPISSKVKTGETITFSGQLSTTSGQVVTDAVIYIKDDVDFGRDTVLGTVVTDKNGKFAATWQAQVRSSGTWDLYAVYDGSSNISKARSVTYGVTVSSSYSSGTSSSSSSYSGSTSTSYPASITLDRIPSSIYAGQSVTFTGKLTSNGQPLKNALVKIMEDDPFSPDQRLGIERTDSNGKFSVTWKVSAGTVETDFDVYAVFDGDSSYKRARSYNQEMSVLKYGGLITLNSFPSSAKVGDTITFSGNLDLNQGSPHGAIVYIKDEDTLNPDDLLATAYVDSFGKFSANWFVTKVDRDSVADIYAVFEGNDILYRLTTCDRGATMAFGASCQYTIPLRTNPSIAPPAIPTGTGTTNPTLSGDEYMSLYYSLDLNRNPKVAIIPSPDSYDEAKRHIGSVQEGIKMWESALDRKFGGTWNVSFEVVKPGALFFNNEPDIVVNIVTADEDINCLSEYSGWAKIWKYPPKPVQTQVCTTSPDIGATAAHEFIHAMGLGHAFNKKGDLMCSAELVGGRWVPTCPTSYSRSSQPSDFNLAATGYLYNSDGFKNPNKRVSYESKFTTNNYQGGNTSPVIPTPTPKTTINLDSDRDGIPDSRDKCDFQKETFNNYLDTDGCPDVKPKTTTTYQQDSDNDGIPNSKDRCDYEQETFNNYLDTDGCPDVKPKTTTTYQQDSDNDGIPNSKDRCDYEQETFNNYLDTDGCPDVKPVDWNTKSVSLKNKVNDKISSTKIGYYGALDSLKMTNYKDPEAQKEIKKAWTAQWWAKKYLKAAEVTQKEAEKFISQSKFKEAFYKYEYSLDRASLVQPYIFEVNTRLDIAFQYEHEK
jgi:hypothetical protein